MDPNKPQVDRKTATAADVATVLQRLQSEAHSVRGQADRVESALTGQDTQAIEGPNPVDVNKTGILVGLHEMATEASNSLVEAQNTLTRICEALTVPNTTTS